MTVMKLSRKRKAPNSRPLGFRRPRTNARARPPHHHRSRSVSVQPFPDVEVTVPCTVDPVAASVKVTANTCAIRQ